MKIGTMLWDVINSFMRSPVTQVYPRKRYPTPVRLRGKLQWNPEKCTGCSLCVKDCPSNAIQVITVDKATKQFVLRYHVDRCTFCAQCVVNCRFSCIEMSNQEWELAALNKDAFTIHYGTEANVQSVLEAGPAPEPDPAP